MNKNKTLTKKQKNKKTKKQKNKIKKGGGGTRGYCRFCCDKYQQSIVLKIKNGNPYCSVCGYEFNGWYDSNILENKCDTSYD